MLSKISKDILNWILEDEDLSNYVAQNNWAALFNYFNDSGAAGYHWMDVKASFIEIFEKANINYVYFSEFTKVFYVELCKTERLVMGYDGSWDRTEFWGIEPPILLFRYREDAQNFCSITFDGSYDVVGTLRKGLVLTFEDKYNSFIIV